MTSISSISGIPDAPLKDSVEQTTDIIPETSKQISLREERQIVPPPSREPAKASSSEKPTPALTTTYEETVEVAEKLQNRINEVASAPHKVSIQQDESTEQFVIQIQDPNGEVVKQFPSEKVLNLHQKLDDLSGMVIDEMI